MSRNKMVGLLVLMLLVPMGQAQWIDDADDDAHESFGPVDADHGRPGVAEIHSVDLEETDDAITFFVAHGEPAAPAVPVIDSTAFDLTFRHGTTEYRARALYGVPVGGDPYYDATLYEDGFSFIQELDIEATDEGFAVTVQKKHIPDQHGAIPSKGASLADFFIRSDQQSIGSICINECTSTGPQTQDQAPDGDVGATYDFQFGLAQDGDIRLLSPSPIRWSNGEATTFVYEVIVHNMGDEEDTVLFRVSDLPPNWQIADIGPVGLQPGEERAIPVPVRVPFAHQHGETPTFLLEASGATGTGRIELGVHYPEVPQPTGHHAQLYFHTREDPRFIFEELIFNVAGGGLGEVAYMNTVEDHDGDESVPVMGNKNGIGGDFDRVVEGEVPDYGVVYEWGIPLAPGLRVGMQTDGNITTEGAVQLEFDIAAGDVKVFGRLAVVDEEELEDFGFNTDFEAGTQIATIHETETHAVGGSVTIPFTVTGDDAVIPFDADQQLVLYLAAHVIRPDAPFSPNTGVYLTEGDIVLPLKEYHDPVPVDVSFPDAVQEEAVQTLDTPLDAEEAKDAPGIGPAALLAAIGVAAWSRRKD